MTGDPRTATEWVTSLPTVPVMCPVDGVQRGLTALHDVEGMAFVVGGCLHRLKGSDYRLQVTGDTAHFTERSTA